MKATWEAIADPHIVSREPGWEVRENQTRDRLSFWAPGLCAYMRADITVCGFFFDPYELHSMEKK